MAQSAQRPNAYGSINRTEQPVPEVPSSHLAIAVAKVAKPIFIVLGVISAAAVVAGVIVALATGNLVALAVAGIAIGVYFLSLAVLNKCRNVLQNTPEAIEARFYNNTGYSPIATD